MRHLLSLAVTIAAVSTAMVPTARAEQPPALRLTLPRVCYAVVGVPMGIYYDNIVLTETPDRYTFAVRCDLGTAESRRWVATPKAGDAGDHALNVEVRDNAGTIVEQGRLVVHVVAANAGADRTVRLLIVGDSLTAATSYPNEIARLLSQPGNPGWSMLGTHRPPAAAAGVVHEGYGGWTWERFVNYYRAAAQPKPQNRREDGSPFVFASGNGKPALDLPRYFGTSCQGQRPTAVTFFLGINDCFGANPEKPAAIDARIDAVFAQADKLIAAFRQAAPEADLGVCLTTPPNSREAGFEANYHGAYHRWGWKRIQHRLVERQLEHFGSRQAEHIFIIPTELNLDPVEGYPADNGVHPNASGYRQIGASIFAWLKSRLEPAGPQGTAARQQPAADRCRNPRSVADPHDTRRAA
jgi:lysophospholipase L1-like esterase